MTEKPEGFESPKMSPMMTGGIPNYGAMNLGLGSNNTF
jgi:hypothetical protein